MVSVGVLTEKRFVFGSPGGGFWMGEPGDVVEQHGPRIGWRYWLVEDVEHKVRWTHVLCRRLADDEITGTIIDCKAEGGTVWLMEPRP